MKKRNTILIADDVQVNRVLLKQMLQEDYDTVLARDGAEALMLLREDPERFDLALIDLKMPVMDGFEVLSAMREDALLQSIPVIVMTGSVDEESELRLLDKGATDYLTKPIQPRLVRRRISAAMEMAQLEQIKSENRQLEELRERHFEMESILEHMDCGVTVLEADGDKMRVSYCNEQMCMLSGKTQEEYKKELQEDLYRYIHPEDAAQLRETYERCFEDGYGGRTTVRMRRSGEYRWVAVSAKRAEEQDGKARFILSFRDVNKEWESGEALRLRAEMDRLTGIYNRETFIRKTEEYLLAHPHEKYVLLRINVERLKAVNEVLGSGTGDEILRAIAEDVKGRIGAKGTYGRLGGDHFVLCIPAALLDVNEISKRAVFNWSCGNMDYTVTLAFGIYEIGEERIPVEEMCECAEMALQTIKGYFNIHCAYYDEKLRKNVLREQEVRGEMYSALQNKDFLIYWQPIFSLVSNKIVGAEALVRWNHPRRGLITPMEFLPFFERTDFITELDNYVLHEVCHLLHERKLRGLAEIPAFVNVSRRSMSNANLAEEMLALIGQHDIAPSLLRIEITESAYNSSSAQFLENIEKLRAFGFTVLMDDFGRAYSSLGILKDILLDMLKVDTKFLEGYENGGRVGTIMTSVIRVAKWLGMPVVAEGVETAAQAEFLRGIGCDYVQGYYFARPMPAEELARFIAEGHSPELSEKLSDKVNEGDLDMLMGGNTLVNRLLSSVSGGFAFYEYGEGRLDMLRANAAYYEVMGITPAYFSENGTNVLDLLTIEDRETTLAAVQRTIDEKREQRFSISRKRGSDGRTIFLDCIARHVGKSEARAMICVAFADITAQREAEMAILAQKEKEELRYRILNENAERLIEQRDVTGAINESLCSLLDYFQAARAYICEFDWEKGLVSNTYEQCAAGVIPQKDSLQNFPIEAVDLWLESFKVKNGLFIESVDALDDDDIAKYILQAQDIKSLLSVPLYNRTRMIGFIGVDDPCAHMQDSSILYTLGFYITNELAKREGLLEAQRQRSLLEASVAKEQDTENRYRLIVEASGVAVVEWNRETNDIFYSPSFEKYAISDQPVEQLFMQGEYGSMIHAEDFAKAREFAQLCRKCPPKAETVLRMRMRDDSYRYTRIRAYMVMDKKSGELKRSIGTLLDMDAEMRAKQELETANRRLSEVLNQLPCGIGIFIMKGEDIRVVYINDSYFELCGERREGRDYIVSDDALQIVFPEDRQLILEEAAAARREERDVDVDFRMLIKGHYTWFNVQGRQVECSGDERRYHCVFSNVDEKHRAELALKESQSMLSTAVQIGGLSTWTYDLEKSVMHFHMGSLPEGSLIPTSTDEIWDERLQVGVLPEYQAEYLGMLEMLKNGADNASVEIRFRIRPGQEPRWMRIFYKLLSREEGRALGIAMDIGEQKKIEQRYLDECAYYGALSGSVSAVMRYNATQGKVETLSGEGEWLAAQLFPKQIGMYVCKNVFDDAEKEEMLQLQALFTDQALLSAFDKGDTKRLTECRLRGEDGSTKWMRITTNLVGNTEGEVMAFITAADISDEKRTGLIIDTAVARDFDYIGYIDLKADEYFFTHNEDERKYLPPKQGRGIYDMLEKHVFSHTGRDAREQLSTARVFSALENEPYYDVFTTIIQKDDSLARKQMRLSYIDRAQSTLLVTGMDITEQYRQEQQEQQRLLAALREAKLANDAKTDFLARMSHDLRTPMNAIMGTAALARENAGDTLAAQEAFGQISQACGFLQGLVSDMLDLSDIEQNELVLHPQVLNYEDFHSTICAMIEPLCKEKNIEFLLDSNVKDIPLYVDKTRFEQVMFNLLSNAVKFTKEGGRVEAICRNVGEIKDGKLPCEFVVRDNGIGMSEEFQKRMFDYFSRESSEITTEYTGIGLGLPVALRIVKSMGGMLHIKSKQGEGTTATVRWDVPIATEQTEEINCVSDEEIARRLWGRRILLVEDNPINARIISALLKQRGVNLETAVNGQEAVDKFLNAKSGYYEAILMDIRMPIMDGWEATGLIRAVPREDAKTVPIIAVSANAFPADVKRSREVGMQAHLAKPVDPALLYATLLKYLPAQEGEAEIGGKNVN